MASIPSKPEALLLEQSTPTLALSNTPDPPQSGKTGFDALQALLAFSSLHQQIRARSAAAGQANDSKTSSDEFLLYEVLQLVAKRALALTAADGVAIALVQEHEIICRATAGTIAPEVGARLDPKSGLSGICFLSGETVRCEDAQNDPRVNSAALRDLQARSIVAVPLRGRRTVIGLLEAFSRDAFAFSDSDVRSLSLLAELILGAMKPEEEQKLEELSPAPIRAASANNHQFESDDDSVANALIPSSATAPFADLQILEEEITAGQSIAPAEIPPALLRDYEKPSSSRTGAMVISAVVMCVLTAIVLLLWNSHGVPKSSAAAPSSESPRPPGHLPAERPDVKAVTVASDLPQPSPINPQDMQRNVLPVVTGVRHWETGDSTTVAIDLEDQVQYEVHRLTSPERIYFDLHDAVLAPGLNGTIIDVGNDLLIRIRVAQPVAGVARVVLDTQNVSNFSVGLEPNPFRLLIEIRHGASEQPKPSLELLRPASPPTPGKLASAAAPLSKEDLQLRTRVPHLKIVIDAGHGGWDLGTVGRQGVVEKDLVLDVSQRLGKLLETGLGSEILYTRSEDAYVPLEERAEIANDAQADLFVSVHANNSDYPSARGVETYYTNVSAPANSLEIERRENATATTMVHTSILTGVALKERTEQSRHLAASIERALYGSLSIKNPGMRDRGVKEAGFVVLTSTTMPAILAEVSFVSSPADERNLQSSSYRQQIAEALFKGIARYAAVSSHIKLASVR